MNMGSLNLLLDSVQIIQTDPLKLMQRQQTTDVVALTQTYMQEGKFVSPFSGRGMARNQEKNGHQHKA